jgi:hypothetical protein
VIESMTLFPLTEFVAEFVDEFAPELMSLLSLSEFLPEFVAEFVENFVAEFVRDMAREDRARPRPPQLLAISRKLFSLTEFVGEFAPRPRPPQLVGISRTLFSAFEAGRVGRCGARADEEAAAQGANTYEYIILYLKP